MISCPKCGELNGETRETCWKCGTAFTGHVIASAKYCPACGEQLVTRHAVCPSCGRLLERGSMPKETESVSDMLFPGAKSAMAFRRGDYRRGWELRRRYLILGSVICAIACIFFCIYLFLA